MKPVTASPRRESRRAGLFQKTHLGRAGPEPTLNIGFLPPPRAMRPQGRRRCPRAVAGGCHGGRTVHRQHGIIAGIGKEVRAPRHTVPARHRR